MSRVESKLTIPGTLPSSPESTSLGPTEKNGIMNMKQLPLADTPFLKIIEDDYLYADKTEYIHNLLNGNSNQIFLSRPRRFGKSLLLNTIKSLFTENRDNFKDLWIGSSKYAFERCPVISLDFSVIDYRSPENLCKTLLSMLVRNATAADLKISENDLRLFFISLICELSKKYKSKVVVLVDEYDAPVSENPFDIELARVNAGVLRDFFKVFKYDEVLSCLRFAIVTGVTGYALTSLCAGSCHFTDITMDEKYAGICGFTIEEFEKLFADRMESTLSKLKQSEEILSMATVDDLKNKIYYWYDGYDWSGKTKTRVLNPYSILKFFHYCAFDKYWAKTGNSSHLTALMEMNQEALLSRHLESYTTEELENAELVSRKPVPILFHTGYLTIGKRLPKVDNALNTDINKDTTYTLKCPNHEVASSFYKNFFNIIFDEKIGNVELAKKENTLKEAFLTGNSDVISSTFMELFGTISHHQRPKDEKTFRSLVRLVLSTMDFDVLTELPGHKDGLDLCVDCRNGVRVIIELKYLPESPNKLTNSEENEILAKLAEDYVPKDKYRECLADAARKHADVAPYREIIENDRSGGLESKNINALLSDAAMESLPRDEKIKALAALVKRETRKKQIRKQFKKQLKEELTKAADEKIDEILTAAANEALGDMVAKDYSSVVKHKSTKIIEFGMAIFGDGTRIKSLFGKDDKS
jgi:hypothetical protein